MKKHACIVVCILLIVGTVLPVTANMNVNKTFEEISDNYSDLVQQINDRGWSEQDKLTASDGKANDLLGYSVAIDGDTALIGTHGDDEYGIYSESAYVFTYNGTVWTEQAKLLALEGENRDHFGYSVAIEGDTALIGAYGDDDNVDNSGSVYVFSRTGTVWTQQTKLFASDATPGDYFGYSVAMDGDTALISALWDEENGVYSGSAYVFTRTGDVWTQQAKLLASDGAAYDLFGRSVAIDGDTAIIGAYFDDDNGYHSGSAYIFTRTGDVWTQQAKLLASDGATEDYFGQSVAVDGDYAIVGSWGDDDNGNETGTAYVFTRSGSAWTEQVKLLASDGAAGDHFGWSVAVDEDTAFIGAFGDDDNEGGSGSIYVFTRTGTVWTQQVKLLASDGAEGDVFGWSVAIDGDTALIGTPGDNDNGEASGSAYVFKKESECCIVIDNVSGGLFDSSGSLTVNAVLRNNGTGECKDVNWSFTFSGGLVLLGSKSGITASIPSGGTVNISSKIVIGLAIPVIFPATVTVTANATNNECPPATMQKNVFLFIILLSVY